MQYVLRVLGGLTVEGALGVRSERRVPSSRHRSMKKKAKWHL